MKSDGQSYFKL